MNKFVEKTDTSYYQIISDKTDFVYESVKKIIEKDLLSKDGTIIIETDEEERITKQIENFNIKIENQRRYGRVHLIFIKIR